MSELDDLKEVLQRDNFVILDSETTGLGSFDQIVQLAAIDKDGQTLLDTLIRPTRSIPSDATAIHGITNEMVENAPPLIDILPALYSAVLYHDLIIYNSNFDLFMIDQTFNAHACPGAWETFREGIASVTCAMMAYAEHYGDWNGYHQSYRWQRLSAACQQQRLKVVDAHSALGDCRMTLALLQHLKKVWSQQSTVAGK